MVDNGKAYVQPSVAFADIPKLELDRLIDELVAAAEGVQRAQGRLRVLLRAVNLINAELSLDAVLEHIARAACYLTDGRIATVGVLAPDGGMDRGLSVDTGADEPVHFGPHPESAGLVGAAVQDGRPLRLSAIDDAAAAGVPAGLGSVDSLLTLPVRVRGEVFGQLFVADSSRGEFSAEDEELVTLLASAAGTAIDNARLYQESRLQQRWLRATADIAAQLLAATGEDPLRTIARHVLDVADADLVVVGVLTPEGDDLLIEVAIGAGAEQLVGRRFSLSGTLASQGLAIGRPLIFRSPAGVTGAARQVAEELDTGPVMVVPLVGTSAPLGVVNVVRHRGSQPFLPSELDMAAQFASQATVALELAAARSDRQRVELLEDRDRIARDLHDHVIQQLFAIGLSLQGLAASAANLPSVADNIEERVEDIDRTIRQIRTTIFALRNPATPSSGMRGWLLAIGSELTPALGFSPGFTFAGPVDTVLHDTLAEDIAACVREALTNVAKHASARRAFVDVATDSKTVTVRIFDDGRGYSADGEASGLRNLRVRAELRGGSLDIRNPTSGGTELIWKAPIT